VAWTCPSPLSSIPSSSTSPGSLACSSALSLSAGSWSLSLSLALSSACCSLSPTAFSFSAGTSVSLRQTKSNVTSYFSQIISKIDRLSNLDGRHQGLTTGQFSLKVVDRFESFDQVLTKLSQILPFLFVQLSRKLAGDKP